MERRNSRDHCSIVPVVFRAVVLVSALALSMIGQMGGLS